MRFARIHPQKTQESDLKRYLGSLNVSLTFDTHKDTHAFDDPYSSVRHL